MLICNNNNKKAGVEVGGEFLPVPFFVLFFDILIAYLLLFDRKLNVCLIDECLQLN